MIVLGYSPSMLKHALNKILLIHRKKEIAQNKPLDHQTLMLSGSSKCTISSMDYSLIKRNKIPVIKAVNANCVKDNVEFNIYVEDFNTDASTFIEERNESYNEMYIYTLLDYLSDNGLEINPNHLCERVKIPIWAIPIEEIVTECFLIHCDDSPRWSNKQYINEVIYNWTLENKPPRHNLNAIMSGLQKHNCEMYLQIQDSTVPDSILSLNWKKILVPNITDQLVKYKNAIKAEFMYAYSQ